MILDFSNTTQISSLTREILADSHTPEWKRDIFQFIAWYQHESSDLTQRTSGSTGAPKAITLPRKTLTASALATNSFFNLHQSTNALLCIPAKYIGGKMMILRALLGQWSIQLLEPKLKLDVTPLLQKVDFTAMIPAQVQVMLDYNFDLSANFKTIIIGGAPVTQALEEKLAQHSGCYSTYGMTETASHVALKHLGHSPYFIALDGITFSTDENNRLIINGNRVHHSPLLTNDVVKLISPTSFLWRGRFDFVINSGGVKIIVEEMEKTIATLIQDPFYIKKETDSALGELPVLVLENETWSAERQGLLLRTLKEALPEFWAPRRLEFKTAFSYTESGKLLRN
ncbi:MAG: AMP-binding protein [Flavobacteriales bacterium]